MEPNALIRDGSVKTGVRLMGTNGVKRLLALGCVATMGATLTVQPVLAKKTDTPAAPAAADATPTSPVKNPAKIIDDFNITEIRSILSELNMPSEVKSTRTGRAYIQAAYGSSLIFEIIPAACVGANNEKCLGANFLARFKGGVPNSQTVTAFNRTYAFATAGVLPAEQGSYVSRYEIADFGAPRGNIASSLQSFIFIAERFREELLSSGKTVTTVGYAEDLAARRLNRSVAEDFGVVAQQETVRALHQVAMEEAPIFVEILNEDETSPHNKIKNIGQ